MALAGKRVELHGLKKSELNGRCGAATHYDESRGRYGVRLDGTDETLGVRPENLKLIIDVTETAEGDVEMETEVDPAYGLGMSNEEMGTELLECARYGELAEAKQLLSLGAPVDVRDGGGNTPLHRAGANGHVALIEALAAAGATQTQNDAGNLPLHWAVQQGQLKAVKRLLELFPEVDVLSKNSFGRSVSTEAFAKGDAAIVEVVLAHASAAKLDPEEAGDESISAEVTHDFRFCDDGSRVLLREIAGVSASDAPETVLGATMAEDRTGLQLWAASLLMSRWLIQRKGDIANRSVLELGAGCGLCGIVAAKLCGARHVIITDLAKHTLDNLEHNLKINELPESLAVSACLDWGDRKAFPPPVEVLIGSDLVYCKEAVPLLLDVVQTLVAPGGAFFYVCPETNRQGEQEFLDGLVDAEFAREEHEVPPSFLRNALADRSDEEFLLLFSELKQRTYTLYRFTRHGEAQCESEAQAMSVGE